MATMGFGAFQKATAFAQNSKLGNGGSPHRQGAKGHWTDHGHHALMRISAFRAVGGYDESFSHNEDAELDYRLRAAGYRIWMTDKTFMVYYPRASVGSAVPPVSRLWPRPRQEHPEASRHAEHPADDPADGVAGRGRRLAGRHQLGRA